MNLPVVPKPGALISPDSIAALEAQVTRAIATVDDVDTLQEWRAQAAALEAYLRGKDLNGPMLAAQRKVEARIGQLLGDGNGHGPGRGRKNPAELQGLDDQTRRRFRILARGLERGLPDEDWRSPREPLLKLIQERFPMERKVPEQVVCANGTTKKPLERRIAEVRSRADSGMRAAQIASDIGVSEYRVRRIAEAAGIELPDAAIGRRARLDGGRILTETINGVDAYVSGLSMLDEVEMPDLPPAESSELMQALNRSINGLRKLKTKMEKAYARRNATAA